MSGKNGFIKSLVGFSVSSWIGFIIGIISVPILTRLLDPSQFAVINLFNAAVNMMLGIVSLGMDSAYVRFFHEPPDGFSKNTLISKGLVVSLAVLGLASIFAIPFYEPIADAFFGINSSVVTLFFVLTIAAQIVIRYITIYSRMLNKVITYTIIAVCLQLVSKFAVLLALPFSGDRRVLLAMNACGIIALAIWLFVDHLRKHDLQWTNTRLVTSKEYVKYSLALWPVPVILYTNVFASQLILKHYAGDEVLGVFLSANIFASILAVIQGGFANFWSGYMMANYATEQARIKKVHDYVCLFVVLSVCFLVATRRLIYSIIGPNYAGSMAIFPMVMMAPLCNMLVETTAYGISIAKKAHNSLFAYILYFLLNNGLALILVPKMGMLGAGLSVMIAAMANFVVQTILGQRYYTSLENPLKTCFTALALILVAIVNYCFRKNGILATYSVLGIAAVAMVVYLPSLKDFIVIIKDRNR